MSDEETPTPRPALDEGQEGTAIVLITIAVVALLVLLGRCLPSRSNRVPRWVRILRHWANAALSSFLRSFPESLSGPMSRLSDYLNELRTQQTRP